MANEIKITQHVQVENAGADVNYKPSTFQLTQTGKGVYQATISAATSEAALSFSGITTAGFVLLRNLDSTNFVEWGPESGGAMIKVGKLKASDPPALFRLAGSTTLRVKADTAACKLLVMVIEE